MTQPQAMLYALAAFFAWVLFDVAIKLAGQAAFSPFLMLAILGIVGTVGIVGIAFYKRDVILLRPQHRREQTIISLCCLVGMFTNIIALKHLPLTIFYIVVFCTPLVIALIASLLKHEKLTRIKIVCLIAGFSGIAIAIAPRLVLGGEWIGYIAGSISVASFALYTITISKISHTDSLESIQLTTSATLAVGGTIGWLFNAVLPEGKMLMMMIVAGGINLLANILYNISLKHTSSTNVAQLHYTQIIAGAFFGYIIWHETPTPYLIVGSGLIIISGIVVATQAHKEASYMPK